MKNKDQEERPAKKRNKPAGQSNRRRKTREEEERNGRLRRCRKYASTMAPREARRDLFGKRWVFERMPTNITHERRPWVDREEARNIVGEVQRTQKRIERT